MARAVAICLGVLLVAGGAARADKPRIAVLGLEVVRGPNGAVDPGAQLIAREVTRELRLRVQSPACPYAMAPNSSKELLDEKLLMSCETEAVDCMVVIAAGLASDAMLYGRVDRRGEGFRISLKLLDVRRRVIQPAIDDMPGGGGVTGAARRLYRRLIGDGPTGDGKLFVKARSETGAAIRGGTVIVDDEPRGQLVGGKLTVTGVGEGRHSVAINVGGFRRFEEIVTLRGGEQATIDAVLRGQPVAPVAAGSAPAAPRPERPAAAPADRPSPLWRLSLVFGAATAVAGGGLAWYSYDRQIANVHQVGLGVMVDSSRCGSDGGALRMEYPGIDVHSFDRACTWTTRTYLGYGIAGVGAAVAVASLIILTRDPAPSDRGATAARSARPASRSALALAPLVAPGLAGAQLAIDW